MIEATILSKHKRLFFTWKKFKYHSWSITELQNWMCSARWILRRYRDRTTLPKYTTTPVSISQLNYPTSHLYQQTAHHPPNNNHFKVSAITKFYPKTDITIIPTYTDLNLQKVVTLPTTPTNTSPQKSAVRNKSLNFSSNFPIPINTSLH